jgi:hypothetical protein
MRGRRAVREPLGLQTWAFDIVLMPEGKRDIETIPAKKRKVNLFS